MNLTIEKALEKGIAAQKAGHLQEADKFYTAILKVNPNHPDANHNMGVLAVSVGKVEQSLQFFQVALKAYSNSVQFWCSYIEALLKLYRYQDALDALKQVKINGLKGECFGQLQLKSVSGLESKTPDVSRAKDPSQNQLKSILDLYREGSFQQALEKIKSLLEKFPNSSNLYNFLGVINRNLNNSDEALKNYRYALKINPNFAEPHSNMGNIYMANKNFNAAEECFKKALLINPNFPEAHNSIGLILKDRGNLDAAINRFQQALANRPDYAEAFYNIGNVFYNKQDFDRAIENFKRAILIKPNYAEAYNNMGIALKSKGNLTDAISSYKRAIHINPNYAWAYNNMGNALNESGDPLLALNSLEKALRLKDNYPDAYNNLGIALADVIFSKPNDSYTTLIISLINKKIHVRPKDIERSAVSLLKCDPVIIEVLKKYQEGTIEASIDDVIFKVSSVELLLALMKVCPLTDLDLEGFLTKIRSCILFSASKIQISPELFRFQAALALQCFTNEYIYEVTKEEQRQVESLELSIGESFSLGHRPKPTMLMCLASYKSLFHCKWYKSLSSRDCEEEIYTRQVSDPSYENYLRSSIKKFQPVTDSISLKVKGQYEENPYPRWVNLKLQTQPLSILSFVKSIKLQLHNNKINNVDAPTILIAGCGTGQHSIGTAVRFKNSKVLAVDLSLASLAYAKRKTEEFNVKNIEYRQADILDLNLLNKKFDIIESVGVLHHMENPFAGWKVLTGCLKPAGLMKIGLYSNLARKDIAKIRRKIDKSDGELNINKIKAYRKEFLSSKKEFIKRVSLFDDFYSLSELRDLLFHVNEHTFSLLQIINYLDKLGLKFCGFEGDKIVKNFMQENDGYDNLYNLKKWHYYENENPKTFLAMYQFWCQKI